MKTNNHKLSGKVAIVTGASKGIGASIPGTSMRRPNRFANCCVKCRTNNGKELSGLDSLVRRINEVTQKPSVER